MLRRLVKCLALLSGGYHKQRCRLTVLSDTKQLTKPMPFLNWRQRTAVKAVEAALQYIKMYVTGVSANTAKPKYFKNDEEQVIRLQSKVWSNL